MIDHTGVNVSDYRRAKDFYVKALGAIGYRLLAEFPAAMTGSTDVAGFGEYPQQTAGPRGLPCRHVCAGG
jgi:catechol 2,3-dioxygenase-like lactoylglutathione lyase family enzyme